MTNKYRVETGKSADGKIESKLIRDGHYVAPLTGKGLHVAPSSVGVDNQRIYKRIVGTHEAAIEVFGLEKITTSFKK